MYGVGFRCGMMETSGGRQRVWSHNSVDVHKAHLRMVEINCMLCVFHHNVKILHASKSGGIVLTCKLRQVRDMQSAGRWHFRGWSDKALDERTSDRQERARKQERSKAGSIPAGEANGKGPEAEAHLCREAGRQREGDVPGEKCRMNGEAGGTSP